MANTAGLDDNSRRTLSALSNANDGTIVNLWADPTTHRLLVDNAGSGGGITIGTTTITGGTTTRVLYDNAGKVGEYVITGTGNVVMSASPTITGTLTESGIISNPLLTSGQITTIGTAQFLSPTDQNGNGLTSIVFYNATGTVKGDVGYRENDLGGLQISGGNGGDTASIQLGSSTVKASTSGASGVRLTGADAAGFTFEFGSALSKKVVFDNGGNVGIGTTGTPGAKLQINSPSDASIGTIIRGFSATQTGHLLEFQNSDGTITGFISGDVAGGSGVTSGSGVFGGVSIGNTNEIYQRTTNGPDAIYFNFRGYNGGSTQFRDTFIGTGKNTQIAYFSGSTGNVGIGTAFGSAGSELLTLGLAGTTAGVFSMAGATSGKIIVVVPAVAGSGTLTLPVATDTLVGKATTDTLSNKRTNQRVLALSANSATPAINTDSYDVVHITSQTAAITSFTSSLTGTPVDGNTLRISITGTASVALTWGTSFEASTVALPTTTSSTTRLDVGFFWNSETSKWRCLAVA